MDARLNYHKYILLLKFDINKLFPLLISISILSCYPLFEKQRMIKFNLCTYTGKDVKQLHRRKLLLFMS